MPARVNGDHVLAAVDTGYAAKAEQRATVGGLKDRGILDVNARVDLQGGCSPARREMSSRLNIGTHLHGIDIKQLMYERMSFNVVSLVRVLHVGLSEIGCRETDHRYEMPSELKRTLENRKCAVLSSRHVVDSP